MPAKVPTSRVPSRRTCIAHTRGSESPSRSVAVRQRPCSRQLTPPSVPAHSVPSGNVAIVHTLLLGSPSARVNDRMRPSGDNWLRPPPSVPNHIEPSGDSCMP